MEKFRTLQLSTLIEIHSDFAAYHNRMLPLESITQEFEDFEKTILTLQSEIAHREQPTGE